MKKIDEYLKIIDEVNTKGKYKPEWNSLCQHRTPEWFRRGKLGIFIHWGVYSVPAFGNEWYPRMMYIEGSETFEFHRKNYGDQKTFGYKDFVPLFKAEKFDAKEWISLFKKAGAKYVVPVAEHHDGYQTYASELSHWNSLETGPHRDVLGELTEEMKAQGLVNCASSHRMEHYFFMSNGRKFDSDISDETVTRDSIYWPSALPDRDFWDRHSEPALSEEFLDDWLARSCELVDKYRPKQLYFDLYIYHESAREHLKKFMAYYYNRAEEWGEEVMVAYKNDALAFGSGTIDMERGQFAAIKHYAWQTCTAIGKKSWGYTKNNEFKSAKDVIYEFIGAICKNASMLLNVGPKPDGTITDEEKHVLLELGAWLDENGEAVYDTTPWFFAEEGPTKTVEGAFRDEKAPEYTSEDFKFTAKGENIFVFVMNPPKDGKIIVKSIKTMPTPQTPCCIADVKSVKLLGRDGEVKFEPTTEGLKIDFGNVESDLPIVLKLVLD